MDRRELLKGAAAATVVSSLLGWDAQAAAELTLDARLTLLEEHLSRIPASAPSELLNRGLRAAGLSEKTFSHILSGLLFAQVFKECSEEEQRDTRWLAVMDRIVPRFTESLAALMGHMEGRIDTRAVRRILRRPNKLARIVNHGLLGRSKTPRERELRQAMGALAAEPNPLGDLYEGFDAAAQSVGSTRQAVAAPARQSADPGAEPVDEKQKKKNKLVIGLALLLGSPAVMALGFVVFISAAGPGPLAILGLGLCLASLVIAVVGVVFILYVITQVLIEKRRERPDDDDDPDEMSDTDVLLAADVEYLLAA
jgi:hypothetical protein